MRISLPKAKWHRIVGGLSPHATTGWDFTPPRDWPGPGFLSNSLARASSNTVSTDVPEGSVIITHESGPASDKQTYLYVTAAHQVLTAFASVPSSHMWAALLRPTALTLFALSPLTRAYLAVDRRIRELRQLLPSAAADQHSVENYLNELAQLRTRYMQQLHSPSGDTADDVARTYINSSFATYVQHQAQVLGVDDAAVLAHLADEYDEIANILRGVSRPSRVVAQPSLSGRNITIRRKAETRDNVQEET